mmetsp:Transcript_30773/g.67492  ORF Transcript_30773/g.67492 Transcript_30773/m.67492 type:complete len:216 (-) Transcript_30773:424-1071(-)
MWRRLRPARSHLHRRAASPPRPRTKGRQPQQSRTERQRNQGKPRTVSENHRDLLLPPSLGSCPEDPLMMQAWKGKKGCHAKGTRRTVERTRREGTASRRARRPRFPVCMAIPSLMPAKRPRKPRRSRVRQGSPKTRLHPSTHPKASRRGACQKTRSPSRSGSRAALPASQGQLPAFQRLAQPPRRSLAVCEASQPPSPLGTLSHPLCRKSEHQRV